MPLQYVTIVFKIDKTCRNSYPVWPSATKKAKLPIQRNINFCSLISSYYAHTALFLLFIHVLGPQHKDCFWFYRYMSANNNLDSSFSPWWQVLSNFWTIHFCLGTLHYQVLSQISFLTAFSIWKTNLRYFLLSVLVRRVFFFLVQTKFDIHAIWYFHFICLS